jgi:hypothetical protein
MTHKQVGDLNESLVQVMKMSATDAGKFISAMDRKFTGIARPMRFDSMAWFEQKHKGIGKVRLREFSKSFKRYGAGSVTKIEDIIAKNILTGESWDKARQEVWSITRDVVGDKQWMVDRIVRTETSAAYNGMTMAALHEEDTMDEPMLKKLVATFDSVTGKDSARVHGQVRKLKDMFFDGLRSYNAPPNRPHDREVVVGWRASWGDDDDMADFDDVTAVPDDETWKGRLGGDVPTRKPPVRPPRPPPLPPTPATPLPPSTPKAPQIVMAIERKREDKVRLQSAVSTMVDAKILLVPGITYPPEQAAAIIAHNTAIDAKLDETRRKIRKMNAEIAAALKEVEKAKLRDKGKAAAVIRLQPAKPITTLPGPGKRKKSPKK